jgi:hypothetical protein
VHLLAERILERHGDDPVGLLANNFSELAEADLPVGWSDVRFGRANSTGQRNTF